MAQATIDRLIITLPHKKPGQYWKNEITATRTIKPEIFSGRCRENAAR